MAGLWGSLTPGQKLGAGALGGTMVGGLFGNLFGGNDYENPADVAMPYLNKIPGEMEKYINPFIQQGQGAYNQLNPLFNQMLSDPNAIISRLGAGYHQSPGYGFKLQQGENAINNAQAAGGMLGSPQHQQEAGQLAEQLSNEDYQQYLKNVLGVMAGGIGGQQQFQQQGFEGSKSLADAIASVLAQQGGLAYRGQAGENQAAAQDSSNIFGALGGLAGLLPLIMG